MTLPSGGTPTVITLGEALGLVATDDIGSLDIARRATLSVGGAEFNVAVGLSRLGVSVGWVGRLGNDALGRLIRSRLSAEAICPHVVMDDGFTGLMVRHRRTARTTAIDYHRAGSSGSRLSADDLPENLIRSCSILHITGITPALSASAASAVEAAVQIARDAGVTVSLDVNYRSKLWPRDVAGPALRRLASCCDIVFAGVDEAELITGVPVGSRREQAEEIQRLGPREVVVKDGARGQTAVTRQTYLETPAWPVVEVDTVGAGDAFVAGYLAELSKSALLEQRLGTARAMGAFAVTVPGDCELLPTRDELTDFLGSTDVSR